jgi:hypothetical protein
VGGFEQLLTIIQDAQAELDAERAEPPAACPKCSEALRTGPDGVLYCRFDGWRAPN